MSANSSAKAVRVGACTNVGKVREENQDRMSRFLCPLGEVFVVADGMGGHMGGATAAAMVTRGFEEALARSASGAPVAAVLQAACARINEAIHREATNGNPETARMGSTVVLALLSGARATLAHAGDSRAYLFRNGRLDRLTRDHSRVQSLVDQGHLTEQEAQEHPDASVLSRCLGAKPEVQLEISGPFDLKQGDALMLCSDGLCGYLGKDALGEALARNPDPQAAANALVQLALDAGGEDNVTVQVVQVGNRRATRYDPSAAPPKMPLGTRMAWVAGLLAALGLMLAAGIHLGRRMTPPPQPGSPPPAPQPGPEPPEKAAGERAAEQPKAEQAPKEAGTSDARPKESRESSDTKGAKTKGQAKDTPTPKDQGKGIQASPQAVPPAQVQAPAAAAPKPQDQGAPTSRPPAPDANGKKESPPTGTPNRPPAPDPSLKKDPPGAPPRRDPSDLPPITPQSRN